MQRFETRFSGKITSINVSGIQRAGCRGGMQQAGMMPSEGLQRSNSDWVDHKATGTASIRAAVAGWGLQTPCQVIWGLFLTTSSCLPWGMKAKDRQIYGHSASLTDQQWFYIIFLSYQRGRELSHSQWVITTAQPHRAVLTQDGKSQWACSDFWPGKRSKCRWITVSLSRHICLQMRIASVNEWLKLSVQFPLEVSLHSLIYIQNGPWSNSCFLYHYYLIY